MKNGVKKIKSNSKNIIVYPVITNKSKSKEKNDKNNFCKTPKNKLRQKLNIKKSFSFNNITNPNNNNTKTIQIINSINVTQYNNIKTEGNCVYRIIDNEYLNMRNKQINKEINKIKKLLKNVNEQNIKKEEEINKQSNLIDKILNINKKAYLDTLENLEKNCKNDNKNFDDLLDKLYKQFHELLLDNNETDLEIKTLKKNIQNTKKNELMIENKILKNQYNIYKNICDNIQMQNEKYQIKMRNKPEIENEILDKNFEILQLQENLKLGNELNIQKENEKADLLNKIKEYKIKNKDMKKKIKKLNQEYNYILLSKKELEDNLYMAYNNNYINNNEINNESIYNENSTRNNNEEPLSSNINSNNVSNIINKTNDNKESINNISNTLEETDKVKDINLNKDKNDEENENNLNTVDEEKITNIESEINFKKDYIEEKVNKQDNDINYNVNDLNEISNKRINKYNESFIEQNDYLSEDNNT